MKRTIKKADLFWYWKSEDRWIPNIEMITAFLLMNDVLFAAHGGEDCVGMFGKGCGSDTIHLSVMANDLMLPAADGEHITGDEDDLTSDLPMLMQMILCDGDTAGVIKWLMHRRRAMPMPRSLTYLKEHGYWDETMVQLEKELRCPCDKGDEPCDGHTAQYYLDKGYEVCYNCHMNKCSWTNHGKFCKDCKHEEGRHDRVGCKLTTCKCGEYKDEV